jgi:hypothetical protein
MRTGDDTEARPDNFGPRLNSDDVRLYGYLFRSEDEDREAMKQIEARLSGE